MTNALLKTAADLPVADQSLVPANDESAAHNDNDEMFFYKGSEYPVSLLQGEDAAEEISKLIIEKNPYSIYYTAFEALDCDDKTAAKLANKMLEAKKNGEPVDLCDYAADTDYTWREVHDLTESFFEELEQEDEELLEDIDLSELTDEVTSLLLDHAMENDDSKVEDLFPSHLTAEIALVIMPSDQHLDDYMIEQGIKGWSGIDLNGRSLDVFARCGHKLGDYRRHSGNKNQNEDGKTFKPWMQLATLDELKDLADNACSSYFNIILYAQVPISDIYNADFDQPITLSQYSIASWDFINGTFHDITKKEPLVIPPELGRWVIPGETGYSPDDICGLVGSYYEARLQNK